jgi:hypothetical protein
MPPPPSRFWRPPPPARNQIAEVGRFAVLAEHRGNVLLAAALMRAATEEMVDKGYTHVITDVFEDDTHSPLGFYTRVMGFLPVATHDHGELNCKSRRITLVLDLKSSYRRLKARGKLGLSLPHGALAGGVPPASRGLTRAAEAEALPAAHRRLAGGDCAMSAAYRRLTRASRMGRVATSRR